MQKDIKSNLRFVNYIVDYVEFSYNAGSNKEEEFEVDFNVDTDFDIIEDNKKMIVYLTVEIFKDAIKKGYPFNFKLRLAGFFEMIDAEGKIDSFKNNAIAILYPYVRSLVTSYTANANVVPLILPTININKFIENKK